MHSQPISLLSKAALGANAHNAQVLQESSSPEYGSNLQRSLQIDMKDLIGDAVGNMSISPTNRDLVLAAKRGLFIIDLKAPLEIPRFLPQGGTWDVADVQWNPHPSRSEYIVSTSCEKLLIWNLLSKEKTAIQHILRAHYRAITDINWHTTEPDMVASTGIDSWVWSWDLRQNPTKPAFGLSLFNGTKIIRIWLWSE
jgi:WD40 repeat protein